MALVLGESPLSCLKDRGVLQLEGGVGRNGKSDLEREAWLGAGSLSAKTSKTQGSPHFRLKPSWTTVQDPGLRAAPWVGWGVLLLAARAAPARPSSRRCSLGPH